MLEDLESLYAAVPEAVAAEQPVRQHLAVQQQTRLEKALGLSGSVLSEIEYRARAVSRLESTGAPAETVEVLRAELRLLAESEANRIYFNRRFEQSEPGRKSGALELQRLSMSSPLELVLNIPPGYWIGGSFLFFLGAVEKRFNMVGRIRAERAELSARRAAGRADEREAEVREVEAERTLNALREREVREQNENEQALLRGLVPGQAQFELEAGTVRAADDD